MDLVGSFHHFEGTCSLNRHKDDLWWYLLVFTELVALVDPSGLIFYNCFSTHDEACKDFHVKESGRHFFHLLYVFDVKIKTL